LTLWKFFSALHAILGDLVVELAQHIGPKLVVLEDGISDLLEVQPSELSLHDSIQTTSLSSVRGLRSRLSGLFPVQMCKSRCNLESVADLAPIPSAFVVVMFVEVVFGELHDLVVKDDQSLFATFRALAFHSTKALNVELEDVPGLVPFQVRVEEAGVDTGLDGFVENTGPVRGKEEYTTIIL
jgi:hypothetical protein